MRPPSSQRAAAFLAVILGGCTGAGAGAGRDAAHPAAEAARGPSLRFAYEAVDGRPVTTEAMANRVTVIGFLTTYDVHSQVEARFLASLYEHHTPRLNVAALMLEAPENRPLVQAFARSLSMPYPIAMADAETIAGEGPFAGLHNVPSVVILDRKGREVYRHVGLLDEARLEAAVREVEKSDRGD